jgi:hypothetical protein
MTTLNIDEAQIAEQEEILASYLQARFPDQDFSPGTAVRNSAIRMSVYAFGILRAMIEQQILPRQSLLNLENASASEETDVLVDQIMANWFLTRKSGQYARGIAIVHLSRRTDLTIPTTTQFTKGGQIFIINQEFNFTMAGAKLSTVLDEDGTIIDYIARVPLIANDPGSAGEIAAGIFDSWGQFSPYTTAVEAEAQFVFGYDPETSAEMIRRAPTAISERSLNTKKGIEATLLEEFTQVPEAVVIGASDPEMMRDLRILQTGDQIHVLNHVNIYIPFPVLPNQVIELEMGAEYSDPSDDSDTPVAEQNILTLPAIPFLRIIKVEDITEGTVYTRSNEIPYASTSPGFPSGTNYFIKDRRPAGSFSSNQYRQLVINQNASGSVIKDGNTFSITYDTAEGFSEVDEYILNDTHRNLSSNTLAFSQYPIWLSFTIKFTYLESAPEELDIDLAKEYLSTYINAFAANEAISMNTIATQLKLGFISVLSSVSPFTILYQLECPDGRLIDFSTDDRVVMSEEKLVTEGDITDFLALQLSDRTVRYLTAPDMISIEQEDV